MSCVEMYKPACFDSFEVKEMGQPDKKWWMISFSRDACENHHVKFKNSKM